MEEENLRDASWFDYEEYENSLANRGKQAWVVFQVILQTFYTIRGVRAYTARRPQWTKTKSLFVW